MDEPRPWTRADLEADPNRPEGPDGRGLTQDEEEEARDAGASPTSVPSEEGATGPGASRTTVPIDMQDDDDFVCPRCGTEIQLKHLGDRALIGELRLFRCVCGAEMHFEHPRGEEAMGVPMQ